MPSDRTPSRRTVLRAGALVVASVAGCQTDDGGSDPTATDGSGADATDRRTENDGSAKTTAVETSATESEPTGTESTTELDLREANVTAVEFERSDGRYRFSVTLYHDDDGEDGYADWWQVESLDGEQLGRRDLAHPHSTEPFTRSETVEVPDRVDCVVVRGHDQTHAYGGQAMLVTLESGATSAIEQGPDPDSFSKSDCP